MGGEVIELISSYCKGSAGRCNRELVENRREVAIFASLARILVLGDNFEMPTRNINLTDHFHRFIETGVATGRYGNASEMMREGLRLLEQRQREEKTRLQWLRGAVKEGLDQIDRGEGIPF